MHARRYAPHRWQIHFYCMGLDGCHHCCIGPRLAFTRFHFSHFCAWWFDHASPARTIVQIVNDCWYENARPIYLHFDGDRISIKCKFREGHHIQRNTLPETISPLFIKFSFRVPISPFECCRAIVICRSATNNLAATHQIPHVHTYWRLVINNETKDDHQSSHYRRHIRQHWRSFRYIHSYVSYVCDSWIDVSSICSEIDCVWTNAYNHIWPKSQNKQILW